MKSLFLLLLSAGFAFAQTDLKDPESSYRKVDSNITGLTTRNYLQDVNDPTVENKQMEVAVSYSDGYITEVKIEFPQEDSHTFTQKYDADGKVAERSEYDSGGQLVTKWTYERSDDDSFKVTELGKENYKAVWHYNSDGQLESAEFSLNSEVYSKLKNTYDKNSRLVLSENKNVKAGQETLFRKTEFSYNDKIGTLSSAKTYRGDGSLSVSHKYNVHGDLVAGALYDTNGNVSLSAKLKPVYKDNGHGSEKVSESWKMYQGDRVVMQGRVEYERVYKK